jgi:transcriptional regulator with XRE-family HTH domain
VDEHEDVTDQPVSEDFLPLGERLKRAREAKGMSLDDVAARTRIPIRHLIHIEREEWDALPAVTYAVGFARNYATAIGLDGAAVARELRAAIGGPNYRAAAPEYYAPADPARVPPKWLVLVAILLAVLLAGGYLYWRSTLRGAGTDVPPLATPEAAPPPPAPAAPAAPAQPVAGQPVILVATGDVWLRISDGPGGAIIYQGSMAAGDRYQLPTAAQHPVIRTGRPQNLRANVGARDLGPLAPTEQTIQNVSLRPEDLAARRGAQPVAPATAH